MTIAELISELGRLPQDWTVCLDCLRCGAPVIGDVEVEVPEYAGGTVWLMESS